MPLRWDASYAVGMAALTNRCGAGPAAELRNSGRTMKAPLCVLALGFILGASIWLASPMITGTREPWDSRSAYFYVALLACGLILALTNRRWFWLGVAGLYVGQLLVMFIRPQHGHEIAPWWAGTMMLALFCLIAAGAALLTAFVSRLLIPRRLDEPMRPAERSPGD